MSMINVSLVGNLTRAPEQVSFASGKVKVTLHVAVNFSARRANASEDGGDTTEYYKVETWGKLAENALKYLSKGNQVGVSGRLIMEHWSDKDGRQRLTPVIAATQISLPQRGDRPKMEQELEEDSNSHHFTSQRDRKEDDELFAGARVIAVSEPRRNVYRSRR